MHPCCTFCCVIVVEGPKFERSIKDVGACVLICGQYSLLQEIRNVGIPVMAGARNSGLLIEAVLLHDGFLPVMWLSDWET